MAKAAIQYYTNSPTATARTWESLGKKKVVIRRVKLGRGVRYVLKSGTKTMRVNGKFE